MTKNEIHDKIMSMNKEEFEALEQRYVEERRAENDEYNKSEEWKEWRTIFPGIPDEFDADEAKRVFQCGVSRLASIWSNYYYEGEKDGKDVFAFGNWIKKTYSEFGTLITLKLHVGERTFILADNPDVSDERMVWHLDGKVVMDADLIDSLDNAIHTDYENEAHHTVQEWILEHIA